MRGKETKKVLIASMTGTKNHSVVKKVGANNVKDEEKLVRHKSFYMIGTHSKHIYVARAEMCIQVQGNPVLSLNWCLALSLLSSLYTSVMHGGLDCFPYWPSSAS